MHALANLTFFFNLPVYFKYKRGCFQTCFNRKTVVKNLDSIVPHLLGLDVFLVSRFMQQKNNVTDIHVFQVVLFYGEITP